MIDLPTETAVVLHDAGSANHAIAWIDAGLLPTSRVFAQGPAATLWQQRPRQSLRPSLADAMDGAKALVSGTGWQSALEHDARKAALTRGIPSIAVLDHWVNYADRFVLAGTTILPDSLLVSDAEAEMLASGAFPGIPVHRLPNLYLEAELRAISTAAASFAVPVMLAAMEPARDDWQRGTAGEFQALDYLMMRWDDAGFATDMPLMIRPHPSEPQGRYDAWIAANAVRDVQLSRGHTLAADIARASIVVGLNSYALVVALAAGRSIWSMLPPWAPACVLPHAGIRHLRSLGAPAS